MINYDLEKIKALIFDVDGTSAPVVTDPEATTEVEVTDPEIIGGDDKGCGSIVSAGIAIIAILGTAIIMKKRD